MIYKTVGYIDNNKGWLVSEVQKIIEFAHKKLIITINNTPPASRKISAPRGVTHFWGIEN